MQYKHSSTYMYYFSNFPKIILFPKSKNECKFHTHPYINIAKFFFIFYMRVFKYYWSHTYIKFHILYIHKTSYTFKLISKRLCFIVCMCSTSNFLNHYTHQRLEISIRNLVTILIVTIFMQIDAQSEILWDFECFEKCLW